MPLPDGVVYDPAPLRYSVEGSPVVKVTPLTDKPVTAVVVLLAAMDVEPRRIGNPLLPPLHVPAIQAPPDPITQSPFTGVRPAGELVPLLNTKSALLGQVTEDPPGKTSQAAPVE